MDISTFSGLVTALVLIFLAIFMGGGALGFVNVPSILITVLGGLAATMTSFPLPKFLGAVGVVRNAFFTSPESPVAVITMLVDFAKKARREGILVLEQETEKIEDDFLRNGIELAVDGMEPDLIRNILSTDLAYLTDRHETGAKIFGKIGEYCPAFGMIGTLVGLVQMLQNMSDPSSIGPAMAVALLTTLYGAIVANVIALPIKDKLEARSAEEVMIKTLMLEGVLAIQSGDNPRVVEQKLKSFLAPSVRKTEFAGDSAA